MKKARAKKNRKVATFQEEEVSIGATEETKTAGTKNAAKTFPKLKISIAVFIVIGVSASIAFILIFVPQKPKSSLEISAYQNKFHISVNIDKTERNDFNEITRSLNIPSIQDGVDFSLDPTSTTILDFLSPIKISLNIKKPIVHFLGSLAYNPSISPKVPQNIDVPKGANLKIFSSNLIPFLKTRYSYPTQFTEWLENNYSNTNPDYLVFFPPQEDFVLAVNSKINLGSLKNLKLGTDFYKEGTIGDQTLYLLNLGNVSPVFYTQNGWTYFASSQEAANNFYGAQNGGSKEKFFSEGKITKSSLIIEFENNGQLPANFLNILNINPATTPVKAKIKNALNNIETFHFALNGSQFSGLISIK